MNEESTIRLGLVAARGIGPKTARAGRDAAGGWREAVRAGRRRAKTIPEKWHDAFAEAPARGAGVLADCVRRRVEVVVRGDPGWPRRIEELPDPPEALFFRGRLALADEPAVAIVGTRESSADGRDLTHQFGERLAEAGWCVTSGLARGIDTAAHRGALAGGGDTLAVLGCGPDVAYPAENRALAARLAEEGALVSEFPPGTEPRAGHFPRRNRVLAAFADAVLVVESRMRGGALVTVRHALDLGREVFVVPGWPGAPTSAGPLALLRDGARAVRDPDDLLEDLGGVRGEPVRPPKDASALAAIERGARDADALGRALGIDRDEARDRLARLELAGEWAPAGDGDG